MKKYLEEYYTKDKPLIEITGLSFVITGLILNIPVSDELLVNSLTQIKFILLTTSCFCLSYLIFSILDFFGQKVMDQVKSLSSSVTDKDNMKEREFKSIIIVLTFLGLVLYFYINLIAYIILSYPVNSLYVVLFLLWYLIFMLILKAYIRLREDDFSFISFIAHVIILFHLLVIPIELFLLMYFQVIDFFLILKVISYSYLSVISISLLIFYTHKWMRNTRQKSLG